jgi:predicted acetyltransferase
MASGMPIEIRDVRDDELAAYFSPITTAFGLPLLAAERGERLAGTPEFQSRFGAFDGGALVGSAGAFFFDLTVPGGVAIDTAGLTLVAVLPTHRRRGVLTSMMRRHLDEARARGLCLAALYASEATIYGRFGYGIAALNMQTDLPREHGAFLDASATPGRVRLVDEAEAVATFPAIWDRVRLDTPGMLSRSASWWRTRRISDPDWIRAGRPPLQRALLEIDGRPEAYALYRFSAPFMYGTASVSLDVLESVAASPEGTRAMWRYLCDVDMVSSIRATLLPIDHPLPFLLRDPRRLQPRVSDGLWVRLVDVGAALSRRGYGDGDPLVLEVDDAFCPWNRGRYRLAGGAAERTDAAPDLALDASALASAYLGAFGFDQLARAGRVIERRPGAIRRADALFRGERAPWCPEIF